MPEQFADNTFIRAYLKSLRDDVSDSQIEQAVLAITNDGIDIHRATILLEKEFTDWQAFSICKAYREGVDDLSVKALADPAFNHSQMRELARIAKDSPAGTHSLPDELGYYFTAALNPDFSAEKMRQMRKLGEQLGEGFRETPFDDSLNPTVLNEEQLADVNFAVQLGIPVEAISKYATGKYPAEHMAAITTALAMGAEKETVERLMDTSYSVQQVQYLSYIMGYADKLKPEQLDFLCNPKMNTETMEGTFYGFFHAKLDVEQVVPYADGRFSKEQMEFIFDATHQLNRSGMSADAVKEAAFFLADPKLKPHQMQQLVAALEDGKTVGELRELKMIMNKHYPLPHSSHPAQRDGRKVSEQAKESREASARLGKNVQSEHAGLSQEKE